MEANELRIGNFILLPGFSNDGLGIVEKITSDFGYCIYRINSRTILDAESYGDNWAAKPIQLTEDWPINFGFKMTNDGSFDREYNGIRITPEYLLKYRGLVMDCPKYVHTFQNLCFALTGKELTRINL